MKIWTSLACASALALATAACNRTPNAVDGNAQAQFALPALPATLPLETGPATEIAPGPSASDLPDAKPLRLARVADAGQAYGYADAAYGYDEALGDAPPDYGFDYDGADPWAWQGYDDSLMVAEPIDDGYRYYYYRPGADEPYFVRDPYYSYGFADGLLAVVYGADGGIVPYADYGPRLAYASRYYARGRQLWGASRQTKRRPVIAANWLRQRPVIVASRERWGAGRAHQPEWQRYYESNRPRQATYWQAEQVRRQADARRFEGWREQGFRSAPPPRAIPAAWEKAKWAQDDRRYRPAAAALKDRRDDREDARQDARQDGNRRVDRPQSDHRDARPDRQDDRQQQAQRDREQPQAKRAAADQPQRQPDQAARRDAEQAQRQAERAKRQQAQQAERQRDREQPDRQRADRDRADRVRQGDAQQAQRQQAQRQRQQAERQNARQQAERAQRQPAQQAARQPNQQAARQQAQQARQSEARAQHQQARQAPRQQAQAAERGAARQQAQEARQAERQQGQQAARQQAQQAQQAQRQQAQSAQREQVQQARQAERQQAQQAQRQQTQQAERAQAQQQRQQRQERRDPRGPGPN